MQNLKMTDQCGLEFEGLENARPEKINTELGHFNRRWATATNAFKHQI